MNIRLIAVWVAAGLTACGGGGSGGGTGSGGSNTSASWDGSSLSERQAQLAPYNATLITRVHSNDPNITPNYTPIGVFQDVWRRDGQVWARYLHKRGTSDSKPAGMVFRVKTPETVQTSMDLDAVDGFMLGGIRTVYSQTVLSSVTLDRTLWDGNTPYLVQGWTIDSVYHYSRRIVPDAGGSLQGSVTGGYYSGSSSDLLWPVGDVDYGFGCSIVAFRPGWASGGGASWVVGPIAADGPVNETAGTRQYQTLTLGTLISDPTWYTYSEAYALPTVSCDHAPDNGSVLSAFVWPTGTADANTTYSGRAGLFRFENGAYSLIAESDNMDNLAWVPSPFAGADPLPVSVKIRIDSTDPDRPYLLLGLHTSTNDWQIRVLQLDNGELVQRMLVDVGGNGPLNWDTVGTDTVAMHNGKLILYRAGGDNSTTYQLAIAAAGDTRMTEWKSGLLDNASVTMIKSEGGKLYLGLQRNETESFLQFIGELVEVN
ncbi:hypothetical protein [Parathalassolituus penaei]|uniref:Uncharacterized protein n=1 Tax=Parathalassolituus penaei TaxID=2997323 RepID=A0A9X3ISB7_9GAMM|nr:hypothetical protein [Parathalassolituus penaei]MCY0965105.1 hypothetical protein [Parathalassolituus penaei]